MAREYNIKWTESQRKRLNSAVRKYNNAVRKAAKANPLAAQFLPSEVSYKELMSEITTARALRNVVNRLERAKRPGAMTLVRQEDGSIVTRYERHEYAVLKSVRERKKSMKAKKQGVKQPVGRIGTMTQASLSKDMRKASELSAKGLRRFIETQERLMNMSSVEKARRYFDNYTRSLRNVFGGFSEYDDDIQMIEDKIIELASMDFDALQNAIDESPSIKFIYDPIARDGKMKRLVEYWEGV